ADAAFRRFGGIWLGSLTPLNSFASGRSAAWRSFWYLPQRALTDCTYSALVTAARGVPLPLLSPPQPAATRAIAATAAQLVIELLLIYPRPSRLPGSRINLFGRHRKPKPGRRR